MLGSLAEDSGPATMEFNDMESLLDPSLEVDMSSWAPDVADKQLFPFEPSAFDMPLDLNNTMMSNYCEIDSFLKQTYDESLSSSSTPSAAGADQLPAINFLEPPQGTLMAPCAKDLEYVSTMIRERLEFSVDLIRKAPWTMVNELETPWSHPMLYKNDNIPKSMQGMALLSVFLNLLLEANLQSDALGACALYTAKNKINTPVIFTLIDAHVNTLLASPTPDTLPAALAYTHALILYQIMRLFDGDISARARGERLIPSLENATMNLLNFVRFDNELTAANTEPLLSGTGSSQYQPLQASRDLWHDWLLHESARRTVLITFYMLQAYRAMATPANAGARCTALSHSWTLSRGMWRARSAVEFARVWREGRWFVVTNGKFADALKDARADDVDAFGRMWITALMGVEETEGWFAAKGGSLREMGMEPSLPGMVV